MQVQALTASLPHLIRRFLGTVRARPLVPEEQDRIAAVLAPAESELFWRQGRADRRHAFDVMCRVTAWTAERDVLAAALLHDVGKIEGVRSALLRSLATVLGALDLPMTAKMRRYRHHGPAGARLLAEAGAGRLAIDFAGRHPSPDPESGDPVVWRLLLEADEAAW